MKRTRVYGAWLLLLCGASMAFAQKYSTKSWDQNDGYVNLLVGGNLVGPVSNGPVAATAAGSSTSISISGMTSKKGLAGGIEAGWYRSIFGVEIEDVLVKAGLASRSYTLSSSLVGGSVSGTLDSFNTTQNFLLVNGLLRFYRQDRSWGLCYPYVGVGIGHVSGSFSDATTGTSGYSLQSSPAADIKFGVAGTWDNGFGISVEYQTLVSSYNTVLPPSTSNGLSISGTLSGTATNSVLNAGISYHFHL